MCVFLVHFVNCSWCFTNVEHQEKKHHAAPLSLQVTTLHGGLPKLKAMGYQYVSLKYMEQNRCALGINNVDVYVYFCLPPAMSVVSGENHQLG